MPTPFIRVIAICVFRHDDRILVAEGFDAVANLPFYRPLGGTVEFGERTEDTVVREIDEELGQAVTNLRLITVLENLFVGEGSPAHEIIFVYDGQFVDSAIYDQATLRGIEANGEPIRAVWRQINTFDEYYRLVPIGLAEALNNDTGDDYQIKD